MLHSASTGSALPLRVQAYVETIVHTFAGAGQGIVSVVLFGSAAIGGWVEASSDVDLILVVPNQVTDGEMNHLRSEVERVEILHGFRTHPAQEKPALERLLDRATANVRSFFICTREDLLSGEIGRILGLHPAQTAFVDRVVLANIVTSGITVWGESLLPSIPVAPIRRFDVLKAFFGLFSTALQCTAIFPLHPAMTKYSMGVLKRSVHNCFFCYELRRASLEEEIEFFERRLGSSRTMLQLLALRHDYRTSFRFVLCCLPTLVRLHWRTAIDNRFPREIQAGGLA